MSEQAYEQAAITAWLKMGKGVPHSPNVHSGINELQPLPAMAQLLADCRQQYCMTVDEESLGSR